MLFLKEKRIFFLILEVVVKFFFGFNIEQKLFNCGDFYLKNFHGYQNLVKRNKFKIKNKKFKK